jgi:electron transfer flavoprotein alpha subunit
MTKERNCLLVFCESTDSGIPEATSLEVLGLGKKLSEAMGYELAAAATNDISCEAAAHGADRIFSAPPPSGNTYPTTWYAALLEQACQRCNPGAVLFAHTPLGQDIAPRLALRLGTWFVSDAVDIAIHDNKILAQKPIQGGVALATYSFNTSPSIITVRRGVGNVPERDESHAAKVDEIEVGSQHLYGQWELVDRVSEETKGIKLEYAKIIVSGGRGIGGTEGFEMLRELAEELGAAVGASRPPCDAGWISPSHQIGITGTVVSPEIYIAVGISGASQHLSGMGNSKKIVAINKDPDAYMFKVSDYGAVCDYKQVLPALINAIRENRR